MACCGETAIEARQPVRWADVSDSESDEELVAEQHPCRARSAIDGCLQATQRMRRDVDDDVDDDNHYNSNGNEHHDNDEEGSCSIQIRRASMPLRGNLESEASESKLLHLQDVVSTAATESSTRSTSGESEVGRWENLLGRELNTFATPFIPTFSHQCPVVGILVFAQDTNTFATPGSLPTQTTQLPVPPVGCSLYSNPLHDAASASTSAKGSSSPPPSLSSGPSPRGPAIQIPASAFPVSQAFPASHRRQAGMGTGTAAPLLGVSPATAEVAPGKPRTKSTGTSAKCRKKKAKSTTSTQDLGVMPEASEEVWQHRAAMRSKELAFFRERLDHFIAEKKECSSCVCNDFLPAPDPLDRTVSRRSWRKVIDGWLKANYMRICPDERHGSVISTEEWQSLAAESFATSYTRCDDGGSECSV
mmetsp:Transcript_30517/g.65725  ORF Transcript_30517/g.65725 Transcript_30517/m.65725 type:complete len:419 (-) Transcript_30517:678-1934(-)|eukprot:CAMPEP_0206447150 /NCGR_PEP_ID=MMETSP0324_2-20121206/16600_1 /ASSEMBLY_ACC=CAM_ASM_000836 /TAXON_ID=2866 /ORGANISM="Crypthecodinium cohnii, Strain Seligo" /LENGTH=418 /DNA_ID=CAMNT_0053915837 /DNA_START=403 /DNA_END=1659 /DNA_ORIENTATION=+